MQFCSQGSGDLVLLHVYPDSLEADSDVPSGKLTGLELRMKTLSKEMVDTEDFCMDSVVLRGRVEETITRYVSDHGVDLVILGVNSNGEDNMLGSHAIKVIEKGNTPVMIIPNSIA